MLTRRTTYALRALAVLASEPQARPQLAVDIARKAQVPRRFLNFLLGLLARGQILTAVRGRGGGFRLSAAPSEISIASIVRLLDGAALPFPCLNPERPERCSECPGSHACAAHIALAATSARMIAALERLTLADVVADSQLAAMKDAK